MASIQLTAAQVEHFNTQGFLVLRAAEHNLVDPSSLQQWTHEVKNLPRENGKWMPYDEITSAGERQLMRTENFADYHSGFSALLHGDGLRGVLSQVTGDDMLLFKDKINYKLAGGNGFGAHLDAPAYDHIGQIEHTTANLAVDPATIANGCVEVVPGSHRMHVELAEGGRIASSWEQNHEWIPVELDSGDLLIFGSHLAHRSASNKTSKARSSVYATYHMRSDGEDLRHRYYIDRRENFPPDHERVPGKDYGLGVKRYAFAAPFTQIGEQQAPAQEKKGRSESPAGSDRYSVIDLERIRKEHSNIVQDGNAVVELSCHVCKANASRDVGDFFDGFAKLRVHYLRSHAAEAVELLGHDHWEVEDVMMYCTKQPVSHAELMRLSRGQAPRELGPKTALMQRKYKKKNKPRPAPLSTERLGNDGESTALETKAPTIPTPDALRASDVLSIHSSLSALSSPSTRKTPGSPVASFMQQVTTSNDMEEEEVPLAIKHRRTGDYVPNYVDFVDNNDEGDACETGAA